jgi:hypothetical protein
MRTWTRGLRRLARELSSSAFLTIGNTVVSSSNVERRLLKPKAWKQLIRERIGMEYWNEMPKLVRDESSADDREEILVNIEERWGPCGRSTIEKIISITAPSSAVK